MYALIFSISIFLINSFFKSSLNYTDTIDIEGPWNTVPIQIRNGNKQLLKQLQDDSKPDLTRSVGDVVDQVDIEIFRLEKNASGRSVKAFAVYVVNWRQTSGGWRRSFLMMEWDSGEKGWEQSRVSYFD